MEPQNPFYSDCLGNLPNFYMNSELSVPSWIDFLPSADSWLGSSAPNTDQETTTTDDTDDTVELTDYDVSSDEIEPSVPRSSKPSHQKSGTLNYEESGLGEIEYVVTEIFHDVSLYRSLVSRASEIYKLSVDLQKNQKDKLCISCEKAKTQTPKKSSKSRASRNCACRPRFCRQKAFVLTSIIIAMKQLGLRIGNYDDACQDTKAKSRDRYHMEVLNRFIPGTVNVSIQSVKTCCRDLKLTSIRLS